MPDTLLDVILDATRRQHRAILGSIPAPRPAEEWPGGRAVSPLLPAARLALLAERSGPKGALAGHLDDLLRHA